MTVKERIIRLLQEESGLSDREITDIIKGKAEPQQSVNQACRSLAQQGYIIRRKRSDGRIGNYLVDSKPQLQQAKPATPDPLSEDAIKAVLEEWLARRGWQAETAWGRARGVDIEAHKSGKRWLIEVKGRGSLPAMRVNYFLAILGEMLQRMDDPDADYSIALPDLPQYRGLWERLPELAKARTGITLLVVNKEGIVRQM